VGQIRHTRHRRSCERADVTAIELNIMQLPGRNRRAVVALFRLKQSPTRFLQQYNVIAAPIARARLIDTLIPSAAHRADEYFSAPNHLRCSPVRDYMAETWRIYSAALKIVVAKRVAG
jgi:hypothetical protein